MIILITGASHTGKTLLAQRYLEKYKIPYLSLDHLKMGLIRSGRLTLAPESPMEELTGQLWPIAREIIKTNLENSQSLIVEGCYIPFDYQKDFAPEYLSHIKFICLVFSEQYIERHFDQIWRYQNVIEKRVKPEDKEKLKYRLLTENARNLNLGKQHDCYCLLIDNEYSVLPDL